MKKRPGSSFGTADFSNHGCWLHSLEGSGFEGRLKRIVNDGLRFFQSTPEREKLRLCADDGEGYRAFGTEYTDFEDQPDLVEIFACSTTRSRGRRSFPPGLGRDLYHQLLEISISFSELAETIAYHLLAEIAMKLPEHLSFDFLDWSRIQLNFGESKRSRRPLLNVRHEDGNFMTITFATAPGLEVFLGDEPTDLGEVAGSHLVVLAGSIFSSVTAQAIHTGFHQVRRRIDVDERLSINYFADASPSALQAIDPTRSRQEYLEIINRGWISSGVPPVHRSI